MQDTTILSLITQASPVVKAIMALLVLASVYAWYLIIVLESRFIGAAKEDKTFENLFWSGVDIKTIYQGLQAKPTRHGLAAIFYDGFSEFIKLRQKT